MAEWCQGCDHFRDVDIPLSSDLLVEVKELVVPGKLKVGVGRWEDAVKEEQWQREARGEMTPPCPPGQEVQKSRSPGSHAKNQTRLLMFQQQLCKEVGLPPSRLQERRRMELEITPSTSYIFRVEQDQQERGNLL